MGTGWAVGSCSWLFSHHSEWINLNRKNKQTNKYVLSREQTKKCREYNQISVTYLLRARQRHIPKFLGRGHYARSLAYAITPQLVRWLTYLVETNKFICSDSRVNESAHAWVWYARSLRRRRLVASWTEFDVIYSAFYFVVWDLCFNPSLYARLSCSVRAHLCAASYLLYRHRMEVSSELWLKLSAANRRRLTDTRTRYTFNRLTTHEILHIQSIQSVTL